LKVAVALLAVGWAAVLAGVWLVYPPAALVVLGALLVARGAFMARKGNGQ